MSKQMAKQRKLSKSEQDIAVKLLLATASHRVKEEDRAEQRVRLFLVLASASIAILAFLFKEAKLDSFNIQWLWTLLIVLVILLSFGIETLISLNWKIIQRRITAALENDLRETLARDFPVVSRLDSRLRRVEQLQQNANWLRRTFRGNLPEFMYLANSFLFGGMVFVLTQLLTISNNWTAILVLTFFFLGGVAQFKYSHWIRDIVPNGWQ